LIKEKFEVEADAKSGRGYLCFVGRKVNRNIIEKCEYELRNVVNLKGV
jgi:hypothetical protein